MKSLEDICAAVNAPKRVLAFSSWKPVNDTLRLTGSLEADGFIMSGVTFMAMCAPERPDERMALNLLAEIKLRPRCIARVDWRGLGHGNTLAGCGPHRFVDAGRTHFHDPELHHLFGFDELFDRGYDLPVALPLDPIPDNLDDLLAQAGELLHIQNLKDMPVPPWEPRTTLI